MRGVYEVTVHDMTVRAEVEYEFTPGPYKRGWCVQGFTVLEASRFDCPISAETTELMWRVEIDDALTDAITNSREQARVGHEACDVARGA